MRHSRVEPAKMRVNLISCRWSHTSTCYREWQILYMSVYIIYIYTHTHTYIYTKFQPSSLGVVAPPPLLIAPPLTPRHRQIGRDHLAFSILEFKPWSLRYLPSLLVIRTHPLVKQQYWSKWIHKKGKQLKQSSLNFIFFRLVTVAHSL